MMIDHCPPDATAVMTAPSLRYREGDQPPPVPNTLPQITDMVIADLHARRSIGISEYGTPLQPHNGRDALRDAYEEALDLSAYLCQALWERENPAPAPPSDPGSTALINPAAPTRWVRVEGRAGDRAEVSDMPRSHWTEIASRHDSLARLTGYFAGRLGGCAPAAVNLLVFDIPDALTATWSTDNVPAAT